ncbi:Sporulation-specific N-acetylmuramoyl-L-alanine amidase [subsurface metagenome]
MSSRPYRLCIDPGHGGKDPGAVNKELGIQEKKINLAVALFMRGYIYTGDYLFDAYMTRHQDYFISLRDRCGKALAWETNAFLSIHTNARPMRGIPGLEIETYHYPGSKKGEEFAAIVQEALIKDVGEISKVIDRGEKEGKYYVLKHTKMPAILVELGFLSDNEEALFLSTIDNQKLMATSLCEAAELFLEGGGHEWIPGEKT